MKDVGREVVSWAALVATVGICWYLFVFIANHKQ
jgi:hypothetical protein